MPREVVFTHRPVQMIAKPDIDLVYVGGVPFAVIQQEGRRFVVRRYTERGTVGHRVAVRHTFALAFQAATEYGIDEGLADL